MENKSQLIVGIIIWTISIIFVVGEQWRRKIPTVGLPMNYLITLSMIHFFAAITYALPWYSPSDFYLAYSNSDFYSDFYYVSLGFLQSVYGVVGFTIGMVFITPLIIYIFRPKFLRVMPCQIDLKLPQIYLILGLVFQFILSPILKKVPSFASLSYTGTTLIFVAICLFLWKYWHEQNYSAFYKILIILGILPIITILTVGFASGGLIALSIFLFVFNFYRPRWKAIIAMLLTFYLGFSLYVTYLRDRNDIRGALWYGTNELTQMQLLTNMVTKFEFFDIHNNEHLERVNIRLNQNVIVGQSVNNLRSGNQQYANGGTLLNGLLAVIPRIIWPSKPVFAGGAELASKYSGQTFLGPTSVSSGQVMEFYINFGTIGVFIGFMIVGTILRIIDITAGVNLYQGNWQGFVSWFLPGLALIAPGSSFIEVMGTFATAIVLVILVNKYYLRKIAKRKVLKQQKFYQ